MQKKVREDTRESHNKLVGTLSQLMQRVGDTRSKAREQSGEAGSAAGGGSNAQDTRVEVSTGGGAGEDNIPGYQEGTPVEIRPTLGKQRKYGVWGFCPQGERTAGVGDCVGFGDNL